MLSSRITVTSISNFRGFMTRNNNVLVRSMATQDVITLSDKDAVDKFIQLHSKSILYYTATWCGPCRTIKPMYETMAKENKETGFGLIDIDDNNESATLAQISSVPTFVAYHNQKPITKFSGADPNQLQMMVQKLKDL